jgi:hypothetical protein
MATKKSRLELYISNETKEEMELLYNGLCGAVTEDSHGRAHVDVSRSIYWESVIRDHLNSQGDLIRMFRMIKSGEFGKE